MNINKFTQKSLQAVQNCERIAMDYGNQEIAQEHLLYALLTQDDSLIAKLMEKMGLDKNLIINRVEEAIQKRPKVQGGQQYVGQDLNNALVHGEDEAKAMGDEYVSVEHLFLAMMKYASKDMKALFREVGISREGFLQALSTVRGNQRVTSDNPEDTYDTLNKYGTDLVERAREQKMDPVIGRDSEIRNVVRILSRKTKNNPVLIGEPGVGKTAAVEGLAQRIVRGDVPEGLKDKKNLTLITNSMEIVIELLDMSDWRVLSTGGVSREGSFALVGTQTNRMLQSYHADKAIISCKGLDMAAGLTDSDELLADNKRTMLENAKERILAIDSSKFGATAFMTVGRVKDITTIVTDEKPEMKWLKEFKKLGIECIYPE